MTLPIVMLKFSVKGYAQKHTSGDEAGSLAGSLVDEDLSPTVWRRNWIMTTWMTVLLAFLVAVGVCRPFRQRIWTESGGIRQPTVVARCSCAQELFLRARKPDATCTISSMTRLICYYDQVQVYMTVISDFDAMSEDPVNANTFATAHVCASASR